MKKLIILLTCLSLTLLTACEEEEINNIDDKENNTIQESTIINNDFPDSVKSMSPQEYASYQEAVVTGFVPEDKKIFEEKFGKEEVSPRKDGELITGYNYMYYQFDIYGKIEELKLNKDGTGKIVVNDKNEFNARETNFTKITATITEETSICIKCSELTSDANELNNALENNNDVIVILQDEPKETEGEIKGVARAIIIL